MGLGIERVANALAEIFSPGYLGGDSSGNSAGGLGDDDVVKGPEEVVLTPGDPSRLRRPAAWSPIIATSCSTLRSLTSSAPMVSLTSSRTRSATKRSSWMGRRLRLRISSAQ